MSGAVVPGSPRAWWIAIRPATLFIAVVPVLVGSAVAHAQARFAPLPALAALIGAVLIQIGTNLANDAYDHEKGADHAGRLGPPRAAQMGWLTPREVKRGMLLSFVLASVVGVYLVWVGGWPIVAIGWLSMLAAWAYTGGPWPLGYHGLGEVTVMIFFGFTAVCGTVFVQGGELGALAALSSLGVGAIATAVLVVNNVRDADTDRAAGKRTLPARFGRGFGVAEYALLVLVAELVPIALTIAGLASGWALLALVTAPAAFALARAVSREQGPALNLRLKQTVRLLTSYGALLAVGLVIGGKGV